MRAGLQSAAWLMLAIVASVPVAAKKVEIDSPWAAAEPVIDAAIGDWEQGSTFAMDDKAIFGVTNDDQYLYLFVKSWDLQLSRQIIMQGLTLRFEPGGRGKDALSFRSPVGVDPGGPPDPEELRRVVADSVAFVEILPRGPYAAETIPLDQFGDVSIAVDAHGGMLYYEMRVPLARTESNRYAVGTEGDEKVVVVLTTPAIDRSDMPDRSGGRGGMGGMGGRGGGGGGRGGGGGAPRGGPEGSRPEPPAPLKFKVLVHLATPGEQDKD